MKLKNILQNIVKMLETSSDEVEKLKKEITEIKSNIDIQKSQLITSSQNIEDIKETNVGIATLLEELAHFSMDNTTNNNDIPNTNKQISNTKQPKLYLVNTK